MKKTLLILIALITVLVFVSCITTVSDFNKIRKGMSAVCDKCGQEVKG